MARGERPGERWRLGGKNWEQQECLCCFMQRRAYCRELRKTKDTQEADPPLFAIDFKAVVAILLQTALAFQVSNEWGGWLHGRSDPGSLSNGFTKKLRLWLSLLWGPIISALTNRNIASPWEVSQKAYPSLMSHWKYLWIWRGQRFLSLNDTQPQTLLAALVWW